VKKFAFFLTVFNFYVANAISQTTFTVNELENLVSKNTDDFETLVLAKGYSLYKNNTSSTCTNVLYWSDQVRNNGRKDQIGMTTCTDNSRVVEFDTTSKDYFLKFKEAIKAKGYKFSHENESTVDGTTFYYKHYTPRGVGR
jgi:hypothetical protein